MGFESFFSEAWNLRQFTVRNMNQWASPLQIWHSNHKRWSKYEEIVETVPLSDEVAEAEGGTVTADEVEEAGF